MLPGLFGTLDRESESSQRSQVQILSPQQKGNGSVLGPGLFRYREESAGTVGGYVMSSPPPGIPLRVQAERAARRRVSEQLGNVAGWVNLPGLREGPWEILTGGDGLASATRLFDAADGPARGSRVFSRLITVKSLDPRAPWPTDTGECLSWLRPFVKVAVDGDTEFRPLSVRIDGKSRPGWLVRGPGPFVFLPALGGVVAWFTDRPELVIRDVRSGALGSAWPK